MFKKEYTWWLIEIFSGVVIGLVLGFLVSVQIGITYGILVPLVFFVLRETVRLRSDMFIEMRHISSELDDKVASWEKKALDLPHVLPYLKQPDKFFSHQISTYMDELGKLARGAAQGELVLKPRSIHQACIEIVKQAEKKDVIFATSYINPEFFWCTPDGDLYRQNCEALIRNETKVTRVFIVPARTDESERQCIEEEIKRQKEIGVKVKRVPESSLTQEARIDLLLIRGKYVAYLGIGGRGDIISELRICNTKEEIDRAESIVNTIEQFSIEC